MKFLTSFNDVNCGLLIEELQEAEITRNFEKMKRSFKAFWTTFGDSPDIPDFLKLEDQAELTRLAGWFLINYGKAQNYQSYLERGKDLLTKAHCLFFEVAELEKAAQCQMLIAGGYYLEGAFNEQEAALEIALGYFEDDPKHPLSLEINVNLLVVEIKKEKLQSAFERMRRIIGYIAASFDYKLKAQFYNQRGIACRMAGDYTEAITSYTLAIEYAKSINNLQFLAFIYNSIAIAYLHLEKYDLALDYVNKSFSLLDERGWSGNFYNTKAEIYLKMGTPSDLANAIECADISVAILEAGTDYGSLVEALWTQIKILIKINHQMEALARFVKLQNIASNQISSEIADSYLAQFDKLIAILPEGTYHERTRTMQKHFIVEALTTTGSITKAAEKLGLKHQTLSVIISTHIPEIIEEFSLQRKPRKQKIK